VAALHRRRHAIQEQVGDGQQQRQEQPPDRDQHQHPARRGGGRGQPALPAGEPGDAEAHPPGQRDATGQRQQRAEQQRAPERRVEDLAEAEQQRAEHGGGLAAPGRFRQQAPHPAPTPTTEHAIT